MAPDISFSVIIPSYNAARTISRTIDSLRAQSRPSLLEEVIVADSSDDRATRDILGRCSWPKLRVLHAGTRIMPALGRNAAARVAKGRMFYFVDADAYLAPDALERAAAHVAMGRILAGGSIELPPFQWGNPVAAAQFFLQFNEFMASGTARKKPFAPSCNLYCDRDLFWKAGGFPEIRASEDVLFGLRAGEIEPLWFLPDVKAFHIFRENAGSYLRNQFMLGKYILVYRRARGSGLLYKGLWPLVWLPGFVSVKLARIAWRVLFARPSWALRFAGSFPAFAVGLGAWAAGFASAVRSNETFEQPRLTRPSPKRRRAAVSLLLAASLVFQSAPTSGLPQEVRWQFAGWCGGGAYPQLVPDPNVYGRAYLASDVAGVWRTDNRGGRWAFRTKGLSNLAVVSLAVSQSNSNVLYAASRTGLHKSSDAGGTWKPLEAAKRFTFKRPDSYKAIVVDRLNPDVAYVGTQTGEVLVTADGGATFKRVGPDAAPAGDVPVSALLLARDGKTLLAGSSGGLARCDLATGSWSRVNTAGNAVLDMQSYLWRETVFVTFGKRVAWTSDLGGTWQMSSEIPLQGAGAHVNRVAVRSDRDGNVKILAGWRQGWSGGAYLSSDFGKTWRNVEEGLVHDVLTNPTRVWSREFGWPLSVAFDPFDPDTLYFTDFWGVWRSDDDGRSWIERVKGAANTVGSDLAVTPDGTLLASAMDNGLLRSTDGGVSWRSLVPVDPLDPSMKGHVWRIALPESRRIVATSSPWDGQASQILLSDDGGLTFKKTRAGLPTEYPKLNTVWDRGYPRALAVDPSDPRRLYLGIDGDDGGGFFQSTDGGATWRRPTDQPGSLRVYNGLVVDPTDGRRLYWAAAGTSANGGVYRSEDRGESWQRVFSQTGWVFDLAASSDGRVFAATDSGGPALYATRDNGATWDLVKKFDGTGACEAIAVDPKNPRRLAVSTVKWNGFAPGKIFLSEDGGATWTDVTADLPYGAGAAAMAFSTDGTWLYATRYAGGVYRLRLN